MQVYAVQATNGSYSLYYTIGDTEKEWKFQFHSENAALMFAAMNTKLLK